MLIDMQPKERRRHVAERVIANGEIDFVTLAVEFGVSEMTIRRDVDELESRGVVRRITGGAIAVAGKSFEPSFAARAAEAAIEKSHIAEAIVERLAPRETVILDSGSSALAVARAVKGRGLSLTVVTPSLLVALELHDEPDTTVLTVGGLVRPGELSIIGTEAEEAFDRYNCDVFVMGVAGVHATRGLSDYHREEAQVKRAAMLCADRTIVAATSNKLGRTQLMTIGALDMVNTLVTDCADDDPTVEAAREVGVEVVLVDRDGDSAALDAAERAR
jgi:DeoR/GlpR family transcriptional regulator of sugar metabolism